MITYSTGPLAVVWPTAGLLFGLVYFALLRWTVGCFAVGGSRILLAVLSLARLVAAIVFFCWAARAGALPVLTALLGFLVARAFALWSARRPV